MTTQHKSGKRRHATPPTRPAITTPPRPDVEAPLLGEPDEQPTALPFPKTDLRHWKQQLVERAHGKPARPKPVHELSAWIEHAGGGYFFPLGTDVRQTAATRALGIYQEALAGGWAEVLRRHPREFTLAVFWTENPMVFTYTTLYTRPVANGAGEPRPARPGAGGRKQSVAVVESDAGCRAALAEWLRGLPDYTCGGTYGSAAEALAGLRGQPADLVMYNRQLPDLVAGRFLVALQNEAPATRMLGHRIYHSSDGLFYSQPAISGGYFFRRRPPGGLLEPIRNAWQSGPPTPGEWAARVCAYVQRLFLFPLETDSGNDASALTTREQDILTCLRSGSTDKEIAHALDISAWTVHTHLKKIYEKLGARSRTEAIIKYLQK